MSVEIQIPVIVLNWNGIDDTEQCIAHLLRQTYPHLKIYLADNGSDENNITRLRLLEKKYPAIELILFDENFGFTKAHNLVMESILEKATCPHYILLLNNDAFADERWAEELIRLAEAKKAHMIASKMINFYSRHELDNIGHRLLNTAEIIPEGTGLSPSAFSEVIQNMGACAGAALYSTHMLKDIGLFDPYFDTGYEDAELGVRANVLGYDSYLAPDAIVYHKISRSVAKIRDFDYVLKTQLNIFYSYFKLMPWPVILLNLPFIIFKYGAVILLNLIFGRFFFFNVMRKAISSSLTTERKTINKARQEFYRSHRPISSFRILSKMEFFLWFDIKRFYKHMIRGEKTQFEKVAQNK